MEWQVIALNFIYAIMDRIERNLVRMDPQGRVVKRAPRHKFPQQREKEDAYGRQEAQTRFFQRAE